MAIADKIITTVFGTKQEKDLKALLPLLHKINALAEWARALPKEAFPEQTLVLRKRLADGAPIDKIVPEAFALAREAAFRVLGERPYDVQILGALVLHQGRIMELKTGEGKTLACVPAAYINALTGKGVHVVTVNDYLAGRDAKWMSGVYAYLGLSVGSVLTGMDNDMRRVQYECDITYGTNKEFGFDYLRDNMKMTADAKVQRGHHYCIIDEVDSILIDESRTPLIISGAAEDDTARFAAVNRFVSFFDRCEKDPATGDYPEELVGDYKADEKSKNVQFTADGILKLEGLLQKNKIIEGSLYENNNFEYVHYMTQALRAHKLYVINVDYVVQNSKVEIVDEFTGRVLEGRRYSDGLHQAIEAKEGIRIERRNRTLASITLQNYFKMYDKIAGMTGTADTEAVEFDKIYGLDVVVVPTNRPVAREDREDLIFYNMDYKIKAIGNRIKELQKKGQPVLVGTASIESSEVLSAYLRKIGVRHEILNAKNHAREASIIAEAGVKGAVTIATNMAGRGTDIKLGGNPEFRAKRRAGSEATPEEYQRIYEEELIAWRKDYEEVRALGGLFILGTERHESRRIDNQLRGRAGRQGDPGISEFYLSLDDTVVRLFANDNTKAMMKKVGFEGEEPIAHGMITKVVEKAQAKVEERNFEIRKHLLDYDDVLNEQRRVLYENRDKILYDNDILARAKRALVDVIGEACGDYLADRSSQARKDLIEKLLVQYRYDVSEEQIQAHEERDLADFIASEVLAGVETRLEHADKELLGDFLKFHYLREIDMAWQDHLESLEALRDSVGLRSYAQKNPLLEYKLEGFEYFDSLLALIRAKMAFIIAQVQVTERATQSPGAAYQAAQQQMSGFGGEVERAQIRRVMPKVGRNELCPCSSGKKYKKCHGR